MIRSLAIAVSLSYAASALAQGGAPPQPYAAPPQAQPAPSQPYATPPQPQPAPPQPYAAPSQGQSLPAPPQGAGTSAAPQAQSTIPPSTAGGSQQVVVNPPAQQPAAPPPPPPSSVTVQQPPPGTGTVQGAPMVVERDTGRPTLEIVAIDAAYGALAGALVGGGIALIDQGNNLGRNLLVGAGAGILVGAAVGGVQAYSASRSSYAMDGLGSPDRNPPLASAHVVASYAGRF